MEAWSEEELTQNPSSDKQGFQEIWRNWGCSKANARG